jgi:thiosulfate dehydrogenase
MNPKRGKRWSWLLLAGLCILTLGSLIYAPSVAGQAPADQQKAIEVNGCDGSGAVSLPGTTQGEILDRSRAETQARFLLAAWMDRNPERAAAWRSDGSAGLEQEQKAAPAQAGEKQPVKTTARDQLIWDRELKKVIAEGYRLYHNSTALGGTIGISCDMCHPDGSNTHPETYPKFQTQLKKVALLRDMINWCIENPEKGKPLAQDDERLRAVEAYILSQRNGVAMAPGKK